ncbi:MAG: glutamine amidotransferase-related protein [Thiolinea sp.]
MKTLGILETGLPPDHLAPEHGSYVEMMAALVNSASTEPAFNYRGYCVLEDEFPAAPDECDGWIITGSKHGVYDELPWIAPLKVLVQEIYQAKIPLVGICFGHQIMVEALGGRVMKSDKGWGLGLQQYHYQPEALPAWLPADSPTLTLNAIHQDQVMEIPAEASVFAASDFCPYAGLAYGDQAFSLQPHPEFSVGYEQALIEYRRGSVFPEEVSDKALKGLQAHNTVADAALVGQWMHDFFQQRA